MKRNTLRSISPLLLTAVCMGCGYNHTASPNSWLAYKGLPIAEGHKLALCIDFGCTQTRNYTFTPSDLHAIHTLFQPRANNAEEERRKISLAIGRFEKLVGKALGTEHDQPKNGFPQISNTNQIDCIAESLNTTQYLMLLQREDLLLFHETGSNIHRGLFTLNAPHNSATIIERSTLKAFAVDSWFRHNGKPAWIVPAESWLAGESPTALWSNDSGQ